MFLHQKTLINTKYKCQNKEKVEHENSVKIQWKICGETKCLGQKSGHVTPWQVMSLIFGQIMSQ